MKITLLLISLALVVFEAAAVNLYVEDEIDLKVYSRELAPTSIANATNFLVIDTFTENTFVALPASFNRAVKKMREGTNVSCVTNKVKTPDREKEFLFSLPINIYLSRKLYQRASARPLAASLLNEHGELRSLNTLFEQHDDAVIVLASASSYGVFLDEQLAQVKPKNKLMRSPIEYHNTIYDMFEKKRADFLLGYPAEIYHRISKKPAEFRAYDIAKAPKYIIGYWMCNNTPKSEDFIKQLNQHIVTAYQTKEFIHAHTNWLPLEDREKIKGYLKPLINKHLTNTNPH
ncbi:hypothetical protein ACSLBF_19055 (plasmid) [Pseudoalteromonas sp. T1lg65]|uniref:hypothetical protein n=1 Tax=Pseudoalteromonas sp. T1lg65 TaxID=2077101 RepID=UPI003F7A298B